MSFELFVAVHTLAFLLCIYTFDEVLSRTGNHSSFIVGGMVALSSIPFLNIVMALICAVWWAYTLGDDSE